MGQKWLGAYFHCMSHGNITDSTESYIAVVSPNTLNKYNNTDHYNDTILVIITSI